MLLSGRWLWQFIWFVEWQCSTTVTNDFIRTIKQKSNVLSNSRTCGIFLHWILCTKQGHRQIVTSTSKGTVFYLFQVHTEVSLHHGLKLSEDGWSWSPDLCVEKMQILNACNICSDLYQRNGKEYCQACNWGGRHYHTVNDMTKNYSFINSCWKIIYFRCALYRNMIVMKCIKCNSWQKFMEKNIFNSGEKWKLV